MESNAARLLSLTSKTLSKQEKVAQAASDKQGKMAGYLTAAAEDAGVENNKPLKIIGLSNDIEGILNRQAGQEAYLDDATAERSTSEAIGDSFSSGVDAAVQGIGGILATGLTAEDLVINKLTGSKENDGGAVSQYLQQAGQDVRDAQSEGIQANRRAQAARNAATADRNLRLQEKELAQGDGSFVSGLRRVGRDFVDGLNNVDDMGVTDIVAAGGGSLLAGGLIGKGLKLAGLGSAAMPVSIGAQEGGAAFTQTYNEMIGKGYSVEQAQKAGLMAAGIQAPIGVATGKLVSKFEANPLAAVGPTKFAGNILREAVEETSQEASGQLVGNIAENTFGDGTNDLLEGVGDGAAMGLIGGAGIAGVVGGPGAALKTALDVAVKAGAVTRTVAGKIGSAIKSGVSAVDLANDKASSVYDENVRPVISAAIASIGEMTTKVAKAIEESQMDKEQKLESSEYLAKLTAAVDFDRSVIEDPNVPEAMRNVLAQSENRFDAIQRMRLLSENSPAGSMEQRGAALFIYNEVAELKTLLGQGLDSNISSLDPASEAGVILADFQNALDMIGQSSSVRSTLKEFDAEAKKMGQDGILDEITDEAIATPEGQQAAKAIVTVADASPLNATLEGIQSVFRHADNGSVNLTPMQRAALRSAATLLKARAERSKRLEALGIADNVDWVSEDISTAEDTGGASSEPSLKEHVRRINEATRLGDKVGAKKNLAHLRKFARHMQNKVDALNTHFASGKWGDQYKTGYKALMPDGSFKPSKSQLFVIPSSDKSLRLAQAIAEDARTVGEVANEMAEVFADLGLNPIKLSELNPELVGPAADVAQKFKDSQKATSKFERLQEKKAAEKAEAEAKPAPAPVEEIPVAEPVAEPVVEPVAEVVAEPEVQTTTEPAETGQPKGGDKSTDVESVVETKAEPVTEPETVVEEVVEEVVEPEPEVVAEPVTLTTVAEAFPNLVSSKFSKGFKIPKERKTRLWGLPSPVAAIRDAMSSREKLVEFIGSKLKREFTSDVAQGYAELLSNVEAVKAALNARIPVALAKKRGKVSVQEYIEDRDVRVETTNKTTGNTVVYTGENILSRSNFKALNLTEKVDGQYVYNDQLIETAILAALQWMLSADNYRSLRTHKTAGNILSVSEQLAPNITITRQVNGESVSVNAKTFLGEGLTVTEAKRSLADKITEFWGLSPNNAAGVGLSKGIAEALAAEMLIALESTKALTVTTFQLNQSNGLPEGQDRTINIYTPFSYPENHPMNGYLDAIEQAVKTDPTQSNFIGEPPTKNDISNTQLRRPEVNLPDQQKEAIEFEGKQQHLPNVPNINLMTGIGMKNVLRLFAAGDVGESVPMNEQDRVSKRGLNLTFSSAFATLEKLMTEFKSAAAAAGISDLSKFPMFYNYNFTSVNRMQMLGLNNPQASKFMRELFLPTRSVIDLSANGTGFSNFGLALAQALGEKVENKRRETVVALAVGSLNGTRPEGELNLTKSVENMQAWLLDQETPFSDAAVDQLIADLGANISPVAVHAIMEYARYLNADEAGKAAFETALYVEADGKANGMTNAMALLETGMFNADRLRIARKGGYFIGKPGLSMNEFVEDIDKSDIYTTMSDLLSQRMADVRADAKKDTGSNTQMLALSTLMDIVLKDVVVSGDTITFKRGASKNPSTITVYGSGAKGIAGNITNEMIEGIYEMLTSALQAQAANKKLSFAEAMFPSHLDAEQRLARMNDALTNLGVMITKKSRYGLYAEKGKPVRANDIALSANNAASYKFGPNEFNNMQENILQLMIRPMRDVIRETIGVTTMEAAEVLRKAVQIQSIALEVAFKKKVNAKLAEKAQDPEWSTSDFLSVDELREIFDSLKPLAPFISNGQQNYYIAGNGKMELGSLEFGNSFDDSLSTGAYIRSPGDAGVSGIPATIIGWGDGLMMQLLSTEIGVERTLKIFDGMHMPLDMLDQGAQKANQAVFQTWMGNPLKAVSESYTTFLEAFEDTLDEADFANDIANDDNAAFGMALGLVRKADPGKDQDRPEPNVVLTEIRNLTTALRNKAMEAEARHRAIARVPVSVDQMAGVGAPYQHQGTESLEGVETDEQIAELLNKLYVEELTALRKEWGTEAKTSEAVVETVEPKAKTVVTPFAFAGRKHKSGARIIRHDGIRKLIDKISPNQQQRAMLVDVIKSLTTKEYKVVYGSQEEIQEYIKLNNIEAFDERGADGVNGLTIPHLQTILLIDPSPEVLLHELIHAATVDKLTAYYAGESLGMNAKEQVAAIGRLEALMDQFLDLDVKTLSQETQIAYMNAADEIDYHIERGNMAGALNEFMAWSLSNAELTKTLQKTPSLVQLARDVIEGIKKLIFGRRYSPAVESDMFSQVRFNTSILMQTKKDARIAFARTIYFQRTAYGVSDRLVKLNKAMNDKVFRHLRANVDGTPENKTPELKEAAFKREVKQLALSSEIVNDVITAGFKMNMQEKTTFETMVSVMATSVQLDPNAIGAVQTLFAHVTKELSVESFMKDRVANDPNDQAQAKLKYDMLMGETRLDTDKLGRSSLLPVFLSLAAVNDEFRTVLSKMSLPENLRRSDGTVDGYLSDGANMLMDSLTTVMSGQGIKPVSVRAAIDNLLERIQETAEERQTFIDTLGVPGRLTDTANDKIVGGIQKFAEYGQRKAADLKASNSSPLAQGFATGLNALAGVLDENLANDQAEGMISMMNRSRLPAPVVKLITDMVGRTPSNAEIYDMIKQVRGWVQQKRQQFREKLPRLINAKFSRDVTKVEWNEMFNGLGKTDFAALKGMLTIDQMFALVQDASTTTVLVEKLERELTALDPANAALMIEKAKQLAVYMNTGVTGLNLLSNANAIAALLNMGVKTKAAPTDALVKTVDALTTLYAFDGLSDVTKNTLSTLAEQEKAGIVFTMNMLVGRRNDELAKTTGTNAFYNHFKGHMPVEFNSDASLVVAEDFADSSRELLKRGYKRTGDYFGSNLDRSVDKRGYYLAPVSGKAPFSQGLFQNARTTASGVDPVTGFSNDMTAGRITDPATVQRVTRNLAKEKATEALLPVFDTKGNVVAYERSIDPAQFEQLDRNTSLDQVIGIWRGRQHEEIEAQQVNGALIMNLFNMWTKDTDSGLKKTDEYVDLNDPDVQEKFPLLADAMSLLTPATRVQIKKQFGGNEFFVRKDMLDDALGYRAASVADIYSDNAGSFQKQVRDIAIAMGGNEAYEWMVKGEKVLQNFVTDARVMIVVKSVVVPMTNMVANVYQLWSRGVPMADIARAMPKKTAEVNNYVKNREKLDELEADLLAAEGANKTVEARILKNEIQSINDANKRLSIWPLIEAGEFSAISDGTVDRNDSLLTEGKLGQFVENLVDKLPKSVKTAGRYTIISRDTALFQGLQKAVEYGDFLGKAVLYDHLTKTQREKTLQKVVVAENQTPDAAVRAYALARITEEFVNYDRLPGRFRGYAESIGVIWFYNFKIRATKVGLSMIRNNPLHVMLSMGLPDIAVLGAVGTPVNESLGAMVLKNGLGPSIGPGMGLHAHMLHPYVAALS